MNRAPIDLQKLAHQTLEDLKELIGEGVEEQIIVLALLNAYNAGVEHGSNHGWHEEQDRAEWTAKYWSLGKEE